MFKLSHVGLVYSAMFQVLQVHMMLCDKEPPQGSEWFSGIASGLSALDCQDQYDVPT